MINNQIESSKSIFNKSEILASKARDELEKLENLKEPFLAELDKLDKKINIYKDEITEYKAKIDDRNKSIQEWQDKINELEKDEKTKGFWGRNFNSNTKDINKLTSQIEAANQTIEFEVEKTKYSQSKIDGLNDSKSNINKELESYRSSANSLDNNLKLAEEIKSGQAQIQAELEEIEKQEQIVREFEELYKARLNMQPPPDEKEIEDFEKNGAFQKDFLVELLKNKPTLDASLKKTNQILDNAISTPSNRFAASKALEESNKETKVSMGFASRILSGLKAITMAITLPVIAILGSSELANVKSQMLGDYVKEFASGKTLTSEAKEERDHAREKAYYDVKNAKKEYEATKDKIQVSDMACNVIVANAGLNLGSHIADSIDFD